MAESVVVCAAAAAECSKPAAVAAAEPIAEIDPSTNQPEEDILLEGVDKNPNHACDDDDDDDGSDDSSDGGDDAGEDATTSTATTTAAAAKQQGLAPTRKRKKQWRKRNAFLDEGGTSRLEKTNDVRGMVTVVGADTVISASALPAAAKLVVFRNQKHRQPAVEQRRQVQVQARADEDADDGFEDIAAGDELSEFVMHARQHLSLNPARADDDFVEDEDEYLDHDFTELGIQYEFLSAEEALAEARLLVKDLSRQTVALTDSERRKCESLQAALQNLVAFDQPEPVMLALFEQLDSVNTLLTARA